MKFKRGTVIELTPKNFDIKGKKIIHPDLVDKKGMVAYLSNHCGYCVRFAPDYEEVAATLGKSFPLFYLDCEKYSDFSLNTLNIQGFPTITYIDRKGKPYRDYNKNRDQLSMMQDICKEAQVCSRRK